MLATWVAVLWWSVGMFLKKNKKKKKRTGDVNSGGFLFMLDIS